MGGRCVGPVVCLVGTKIPTKTASAKNPTRESFAKGYRVAKAAVKGNIFVDFTWSI